jgi:hypothetical protein
MQHIGTNFQLVDINIEIDNVIVGWGIFFIKGDHLRNQMEIF